MNVPNFFQNTVKGVTGVEVKIYDGRVCVYEFETIQSNKNDLRILLQNLRDVQSNVNVFLTTLIQQRDAITGEQKTTNRSIFSNIVRDSVVEKEEVSPKKCKLSI
ncbi:hypothetical protein ACFW04_002056 [Cataglyphis niger]